MRGDSGFCRWRTMSWCDRSDVGCIWGLAKNSRPETFARSSAEEAKAAFEETGEKQVRFQEFAYAAESWDRERRVIARTLCGSKGSDTRFVVTSLEGDAEHLYRNVCCQRGEMENRIREQQLHLFADRTSCHQWQASQLRLLLSSLAWVLVHAIREKGLRGTRLARAQIHTIRLKLFRIGAVITRNTRCIRFHLSSACPDQDLFRLPAARLKPGQPDSPPRAENTARPTPPTRSLAPKPPDSSPSPPAGRQSASEAVASTTFHADPPGTLSEIMRISTKRPEYADILPFMKYPG